MTNWNSPDWNGFAGSIAQNNRDALLTSWLEKKAAFDKAQSEERAARKELEEVFSNEDLTKLLAGTESINVTGGKLKFVRTINYEFKAPGANGKNFSLSNDVVNAALDRVAKAIEGTAGIDRAQNVVKWVPELSLTKYKELVRDFPAAAKELDKVLMTSQASTQVKFEKD